MKALILLLLLACGPAQRAAAQDPLKCERDPTCGKKRKHNDCYAQCADNPACVERCREVEVSAGFSGR